MSQKRNRVEWFYRDLQNWINNGCDKNVAKQVKRLDISDNKLINIPIEISNLTQLKKFDCSCNQITEIPKEIFNLKITFLKLSVSEIRLYILQITNKLEILLL